MVIYWSRFGGGKQHRRKERSIALTVQSKRVANKRHVSDTCLNGKPHCAIIVMLLNSTISFTQPIDSNVHRPRSSVARIDKTE